MYGISTWNDLLRFTFGEINREQNKYVGKEGLERAINELKEFKTKNNRLPKKKDKEMNGIVDAIRRYQWLAFGIKTWNDLLVFVFNKVNKNWNGNNQMNPTYIPRIQIAINELKRENKRISKTAIAKKAKISRNTIRRYPELLRIINEASAKN
ncbi:MAG: hypothetical protein ACTSRC_19360 [Candidatus Helarchaeota archaeon]